MVAPGVAIKLKKQMIATRKEKSHSFRRIEGFADSKNYIIIDDFVSTGETIETIITELKEFVPRANCVGIFLYRKPWKFSTVYDVVKSSLKKHNLTKEVLWNWQIK